MHRDKKKNEGFQEWQPAFARSHIRTVGSPIATKQAEMYQESVRNTLSSHCCGVIVTVSSLLLWCHLRRCIIVVLLSWFHCHCCGVTFTVASLQFHHRLIVSSLQSHRCCCCCCHHCCSHHIVTVITSSWSSCHHSHCHCHCHPVIVIVVVSSSSLQSQLSQLLSHCPCHRHHVVTITLSLSSLLHHRHHFVPVIVVPVTLSLLLLALRSPAHPDLLHLM